MLNYIYVIITSVLVGFVTMAEKLWQRKTYGAEYSQYVFLTVMSFCSMIIFFIMSGFNIYVNPVTLAYSFIYAILALVSVKLSLSAMAHMNLILYSTFYKGSPMPVWIFGILFFHDSLKINDLISALLITASIIVPLFEMRNGKSDFKGYIIGILLTLSNALSVIILKFYAASPSKMPDSIMCLYTNVFLLAFLLAKFLLSQEKQKYISTLLVTKKILFIIPLSTLSNNLSTLLQMHILKSMELSLFSLISSAAGCIILFINSKVIFKEHCSKSDFISFLLSTAAIAATLI